MTRAARTTKCLRAKRPSSQRGGPFAYLRVCSQGSNTVGPATRSRRYLAGMVRTFPTGITLGFEMPLACTMAATVTPYCAAIAASVSPLLTS